MKTRITLLAALLAAALPVMAQTSPAAPEKSQARVQVVDEKARPDGAAAKQGAKAAKAQKKKKPRKAPRQKTDKPKAARAG
jgi:hypothetical protein